MLRKDCTADVPLGLQSQADSEGQVASCEGEVERKDEAVDFVLWTSV